MVLVIKNPEVEKLADEVVTLSGVSRTEAVRQALREKKRLLISRVAQANRREKLKNLLEREIWPNIPKEQLGKRLTRKEKDKFLGYGN